MRKLFLLALVAALTLTSCSKEEDTLETNQADLVRKGGGNSSSSTYDCGIDFGLQPVDLVTQWNILDNGPGYIDYHLEQIYSYNWQFNVRLIKRGDPIQVGSGEAWFFDGPLYNDPVTGNPVYEYLSDAIPPEKADMIGQDLACQMKDFVDAAYPGYFIYDVDVIGDATLCGSDCSTRILRTTFKIGF